MQYLKQSTAVYIQMGPFVDATDGFTPETGLTINRSDVLLSKNDSTFSQKANVSGGTHDTNGWYRTIVDATDTGTLGRLLVFVYVAGARPVRQEYMVVAENVYDSLFGSDRLQVDVRELGDSALGLTTQMKADVNTEADTALTDYDPPTKTEMDAGFAGLNDPTAAAIADAVWDEAKAGHVAAGSFGEEVQAHSLSSEISALNDLSAADVWAYATRTLTQSAASVTSAVSGSAISIRRGDTLSASITGLGDISTRSKLWFTVKGQASQADTAAIIMITEGDGLVYLNGAPAGTPANGSITVNDASDGDITIVLEKTETANLSKNSGLTYDIQVLTSAGVVTTLTEGSCDIPADITRAIS